LGLRNIVAAESRLIGWGYLEFYLLDAQAGSAIWRKPGSSRRPHKLVGASFSALAGSSQSILVRLT